MSDERYAIKVVGVDKEAIEMIGGKQDVWGIPFRLSSKPDQDWEKKYFEVSGKDKSLMKKKVHLIGDLIKVEISEMDDLQKVLDIIKAEVKETNSLCEGDYQLKVKLRQDLETLQNKQFDVTKKFKEDSDKLQF